MKHIKLYEGFEDGVDPSMRDMFGLTEEFTIKYINPTPYGDKEEEYCKIIGPSENFDAAEEIIDDLEDELERTKRNMSSDGEYMGEMEIEEILFDEGYYDRLLALGYGVYYNGKEYIPPSSQD